MRRRNGMAVENTAASISTKPSDEPLSTTITSNRIPICPVKEYKQHRSRSRRFQFTTTTDTRGSTVLCTCCCIIRVRKGVLPPMPSVGEILRNARLRQGLSLAQVETQTRIRLKFLDALESDRFDEIPGKFFVRSFSLQYG